MKKLFRPAALIALASALSGCSKEHHPSPNPDPGKPFIVQVVNNGETRGAEISAVSAFKMVGVQGTSNMWMDNFLFTNSGSGWGAVGHENLHWPGGTDKHTFYATCDNTDAAPAIENGKFVYTVPSDVSSQKDLLVSLSEDNEDGTPVSLLFKHALSSVKFKIGFDKEARGGDYNLHFHVTKITLHHIATKGIFDFANYASAPWTVDPEDAGYEDIVITLKTPVDFTPSAVSEFISLDGNIDGEIYVMPHKPTPWDTDGTYGHPLNNSYIGVTCQVVEYMPETFYDLAGLDENSDEEDYDDAQYMYINFYKGYGSTDNDDWLNDQVIGVHIPTASDWAEHVILESTLKHRNAEAAANGTEDNVEEIFIPLEMTNGFGFNKTNVITVRMDKMKYDNGKDFYAPHSPIIPINP